MVDELPELPRSDDPFELLGVPPGSDEKTLKRAYVRLIRVYRPDRHPAEFGRVRQAYEQAVAMAAWWSEQDDPEEVGSEGSPADEPAVPEGGGRASPAPSPRRSQRRGDGVLVA